jgi:hypothetical protein
MGKTAMQLQNYNFHNINKEFAVPPVAAPKIKPNPSFAKDFTKRHIRKMKPEEFSPSTA